MKKANLLAQAVFTAASLLCITSFTQEARSADLNSSVEAYGSYVLYHWNKDEKLRNHPAPQIITDLDPNTMILGACVSNYNGKLSTDIGGTSYCKRSNTIYVVQSQIAPLYKHFGPAAVAYVIAHEYGHYLQSVFDLPYLAPVSELQADCLSGAILGQGAKALDITARDIINMAQAAYTIGSTSHGSGAQRAYAVYAGFGLSPEITCSIKDIQKLANNQVKDPTFKQLSTKRSTEGIDLDRPQSHLRSISGSLLGSL